MRDFRLRSDLQRAVIGGFALPLGIDPGTMAAPVQGYTLAYTPGSGSRRGVENGREGGDEDTAGEPIGAAEDDAEGGDDPDTYVFHIVVSHEQLAPLVRSAFALLPEQVYGIVEIGSRDAYRSTDVYIGEEPISREEFIETWREFETLLLEDGTIGIGANSDEPFIEVFIDQWKGVAIHVPLDRREEVERVLHRLGLEEVPQTWGAGGEDEEGGGESHVRPVLDLQDEYSPDIDELLLLLRQRWRLELNVDPETNVDERGRNLGLTLWHAVVIVEDTAPSAHAPSARTGSGPRTGPRSDPGSRPQKSAAGRDGHADDLTDEPDGGAYASIWATASSLAEMSQLIDQALEDHRRWRFAEIYTIDRVAYDERPDQLADLPPRRFQPQVHFVEIDPWTRPDEATRVPENTDRRGTDDPH
jgi:hypothetical protein